jgi:hypothetical protein
MIAAWPPLALLLTVELISRVPTHRHSLAVIRLAATAGIAGIAAWVSYWHRAAAAGTHAGAGAIRRQARCARPIVGCLCWPAFADGHASGDDRYSDRGRRNRCCTAAG